MHVLESTNVNQALHEALYFLEACGEREESRNGTVLVAPGPVMTVYKRPWERVLFSPLRNANPFFHFFESLWMLAGRNDIAFPAYFNSQMANYSDDGITQHGAYGYRWQQWFGANQLNMLVEELRKNPNSRRAVLAMWDASRRVRQLPNGGAAALSELEYATRGGKDACCNTHIYFDLRHGVLNMTVCCRSNDIFWGTYGANAVHFSFLQEYLALRLNAGIGAYRQFSNNFHAYTDVFPLSRWHELAEDAKNTNFYELCGEPELYPEIGSHHFPLMETNLGVWEQDLEQFFNYRHRTFHYTEPFFEHVAAPMFRSWFERKEKISNGLEWAQKIGALDWRLACVTWIKRREQERLQKQEGVQSATQSQ